MQYLVIEAARTDHKHTQDPQFLREQTAREDTGELMVLLQQERNSRPRLLDLRLAALVEACAGILPGA